jgi:hypothetical protein
MTDGPSGLVRAGEPLRHQANCTFLALTSPRLLDAARPVIAGVANLALIRCAGFRETTIVAASMACWQTGVQGIQTEDTASFLEKPDRLLRFQQQ